MTLTQEQLEWIVSEVVRRLRAAGYGDNASPAAASATTTLAITDRLVTLATLEGKLQGVAAVQVGYKAIVTPAVVDHLKEKQITLVRQ
ncbi:hypothetical protein [Aeoliella mucimassa]|uniref:Uncharacterized protein n=1 Tax=Aeoliella mucimassa TaxID=2527972 RepID=A0A518APY6_9BACT|nr:hypothetical protein [Aeoliella mucimassa]QDU56785.1 hypothetical protein Pan181_29970 [Aeoliella mucimassa]